MKLLTFLPIILSFLASRANAVGRESTLFWETDALPLESDAEQGVFRLGLENFSYFPAKYPCLFSARLIPLVYQGLQMGTQCAIQTGETHILATEIFPEAALRSKEKGVEKFRPGVKIALTEILHIGKFGQEGALVFGRFSYKLSPKENENHIERVSESGYSVIQLQKWADILDSMYSFGWSYRKADPQTNRQAWALKISYAETLPLELRRIGFLEDTASVSLKTVDVSIRNAFGSFVLGGGLGYAAVTLDTVRFSLFYPTFALDYTW